MTSQPIDHLYHAAYHLEQYLLTLADDRHREFIGGVMGSLISYIEAEDADNMDNPVPLGVE